MSAGSEREFIDYLQRKEGKTMKCPLFRLAQLLQPREVGWKDIDCLKEECAWWQPEIGNCIIYQLGMEIGTLCLFLEEIKKKMPHELQFRKV